METITKKYRLLENDTRIVNGKTLYRIEALKDFAGVKKGHKGGYIESEKNLSQRGICWVSDNACVFRDAQVFGDAWVSGDACVSGDARVCGDAWVYGKAQVYGKAWVYGKARVCGESWVYGKAWVSGKARVCGDAWACGDARIYEGEITSGAISK